MTAKRIIECLAADHAAIKRMGAKAAWLVTVVAIAQGDQDTPISINMMELCSMCGVPWCSKLTIRKYREAAVRAGWLEYQFTDNAHAGLYRARLPGKTLMEVFREERKI